METSNIFKEEEERDQIRIAEIQAILENNLYEPEDEEILMSERDSLERKYNLLDRCQKTKEASDFKIWSESDMEAAFWLHLGRYNKCPNSESFHVMMRAYLWAVHANGRLARAFSDALRWSDIDFFRDSSKFSKNN